jgi:hypothetical protein
MKYSGGGCCCLEAYVTLKQTDTESSYLLGISVRLLHSLSNIQLFEKCSADLVLDLIQLRESASCPLRWVLSDLESELARGEVFPS